MFPDKQWQPVVPWHWSLWVLAGSAPLLTASTNWPLAGSTHQAAQAARLARIPVGPSLKHASATNELFLLRHWQ